MRHLHFLPGLLFLCLFSSEYVWAQACSCVSKPDIADFMPCHKIPFDNGASLSWQYNCDSSWLTFESIQHRKRVIFSLEAPLMELSGRLGYTHIQEYKSTFLVQNNVISGCCTPPEFHLYNKQNGKKLYELGRLIFYSEQKKLPFAIGIAYPKRETEWYRGLSALIVYNLSTGRQYRILLPANITVETLNASSYDPNPEYLFEQAVIKGHTVNLHYSVYKNGRNIRYPVTIDLDQYR
ncbi:hypothetical protein D3C71_90270 [compost metagenome]